MILDRISLLKYHIQDYNYSHRNAKQTCFNHSFASVCVSVLLPKGINLYFSSKFISVHMQNVNKSALFKKKEESNAT